MSTVAVAASARWRGIPAAAVVPAGRGCVPIRLRYGCCQKRINMSVVQAVPRVSFKPLRSMLCLSWFQR